MRKDISSAGLLLLPFIVLVLALVCLPVVSLGATEQSFTGKVIGVECSAAGIIVKISVTARKGITAREATAQRRPSVEEVRLDLSCQTEKSSIWKFIHQRTRKKVVTVRFSSVDRGNHPVADVLLPGNQSLTAVIEASFPSPPLKN